ncbi:MAG TPA: antibiotic biosynthesis monooxygenase [Gammaproteobacteria bacterium]
MATHAYMYVWEFIVATEHVAAFEQAYGPDGDWVRLFRRAEGYLRTELLKDPSRPGRYLTVDAWASRGQWEEFRTQFAKEFEALDAQCEGWTVSEPEIGRFDAW